ncbi:MFS general substrate transporter [Echria macrotheca]|uniref:MFS general substrate transporter n=1 Tax=Echria macrotheca TaxID=438768 RepID=A0AAJ0BDL3_9PEZI|nr:MFS general substrate transporter [Echria macrotheca]
MATNSEQILDHESGTASSRQVTLKCEPTTTPEYTVWWDEPENLDPANPLNWSPARKWANIITLSVISFLVPLVSAMMAPAVQEIMADLDTDSTLFATFSVSIFVLGFASGPLLLAPLSELYGRAIVYNVTNALFLLFTVLCGQATSPGSFLALRFLSGFVGVATITIGSGTIADLMPRDKRGKAVSAWAVGTILGPMIGPIVGGYVAEAAGWRWMFHVMTIVVGVVNLVAAFILRETYPQVLLERKAARLRKQTGNPNYRSRLATDETPRELFLCSIVRPSTMLLCCPIVTILCTYVAVLYGTLYLLFATYSFVFKQVYGFSTSAAGLVFIAGALGTLLGLFYMSQLSDSAVKKRVATGKPARPEDRLPLLITIPGALTFPAGLFVYGWTVEAQVHWIVPQIGTAITGFGSILIFIGIQTYLIDAFEEYAASAVGANAVLRGLAGALLPLSGLKLYDTLGWGWGNSLLGFLSLALAPVPVLFGMYGHRIRNLRGFQVKV